MEEPTSPPFAPSCNPEGSQPDRWTPTRMAEFLRRLVATQSVTDAARSVGMSRQSAYRLRARLKGQPFDIAWEAAFQHGYDELAHAALERATNGVEVPIYHGGQQVGSYRKYDERLTCFLLAQRNSAGAQQLGRYSAAAEFWSRRWDQMLDLVENGPARWPADGDWPYAAGHLSEDERDLVRRLETRHTPDRFS